MPDFAMCANLLCPQSPSCLRFTAKAAKAQGYLDHTGVFMEGLTCMYFVPNKKAMEADA